MKFNFRLTTLPLVAFFALVAGPVSLVAQQQPVTQQQQQTRPRTAGGAEKPGERLEPDDASAPPRADVPAETLANRRESISEEEASIAPHFNNFLASYRLGPEDVISIIVDGTFRDRYSKGGILIPPDGKVAHPLLPDGIFVVGKTTKQVQDELIALFEEFIIDPKVTVSLDKAQSAAFAVFGDVAQPGIRIMARRYSVTEALDVAGGVLPTGNAKKVVLFRRTPDNYIQQHVIDVAAIRKGKRPDDVYLAPGDRLVVPGNNRKKLEEFLRIASSFSLLRVFTGGIF
ncbi:MAG: polysaccharide biosynthesis/export family protein [Pyrinomonadaceae bacterium]